MKTDFRLTSLSQFVSGVYEPLEQIALEGDCVSVVVLATRTNGDIFVFDRRGFALARGYDSPLSFASYVREQLKRGFMVDISVEEVVF